MKYKLLIKNASEIVQVCSNREKYVVLNQSKEIAILKQKSCTYSIVVDRNGRIADIGLTSDIISKHGSVDDSYETVFDASGCSVVPGFVDGHTHPVWAGNRVHEFEMKLAGATYMDIHKMGGGIGYTVEQTRNETEENLYVSFKERLRRMLRCGTTLAECKSGYGLDLETEMKMLRVISNASKDPDVPMQISCTYCGAHSIPKGKTSEEATNDVINTQIPAIASAMRAGQISVNNIDVFCEKGVFDVEQTRRILQAGRVVGMKMNFHGDELNATKSAELACELNALAVSHLEEISDEGIKGIAKSKTAAVILPTTAYILRLSPPPVRKMIENDVIVALGSDFNPNAHCYSMPMVMNLACVTLKMSMSEALVAATINSAYSLGKSDTHGSIEVGKQADVVILRSDKWQHVIYEFGSVNVVIKAVVVGGKVCHTTNE